jgi:hypothetical protein
MRDRIVVVSCMITVDGWGLDFVEEGSLSDCWIEDGWWYGWADWFCWTGYMSDECGSRMYGYVVVRLLTRNSNVGK